MDAPCPSSLFLLFAVVVLSPTFLLLGVSFLVVPSPILLLIVVSPLLLDVFLVVVVSLQEWMDSEGCCWMTFPVGKVLPN